MHQNYNFHFASSAIDTPGLVECRSMPVRCGQNCVSHILQSTYHPLSIDTTSPETQHTHRPMDHNNPEQLLTLMHHSEKLTILKAYTHELLNKLIIQSAYKGSTMHNPRTLSL